MDASNPKSRQAGHDRFHSSNLNLSDTCVGYLDLSLMHVQFTGFPLRFERLESIGRPIYSAVLVDLVAAER